MYERKFISIKYTRSYSYAKFGTFFAPLGMYSTSSNMLEIPNSQYKEVYDANQTRDAQ